MAEKNFDQWAILEIMGHQTYAGRVTNETVGGASFVRLDVPEAPGKPAFTKLFGPSSIYCITLVSEQAARLRAQTLDQRPMSVWDPFSEIRGLVSREDLASPEDRGEDDWHR